MPNRNLIAVDQALDGLRATAPSTVVGGAEVRAMIVVALERMRTSYHTVTDRLAAIDVNDLRNLQTAVDELATPMIQCAEELAGAALAIQLNQATSGIARDSTSYRELGTTTIVQTS